MKDIYDALDQAPPLDPKLFWEAIETARLHSREEGIEHHEAFGRMLAYWPRMKVASAFALFRSLSEAINNDEAYEVLGGSDDGFTDGRAWAISQGQPYYERLRDNPRSLLGSKTREYEVFAYVFAYAAEDGPRRNALRQAGLARHEAQLLEKSTPAAAKSQGRPGL